MTSVLRRSYFFAAAGVGGAAARLAAPIESAGLAALMEADGLADALGDADGLDALAEKLAEALDIPFVRPNQ